MFGISLLEGFIIIAIAVIILKPKDFKIIIKFILSIITSIKSFISSFNQEVAKINTLLELDDWTKIDKKNDKK